MREAWAKGDKMTAARFARDAAPYVHPKLAAIEHTGSDGHPLLPDASPGDIARAVLEVLREAHLAISEIEGGPIARRWSELESATQGVSQQHPGLKP
jgi:hypothetical protein